MFRKLTYLDFSPWRWHWELSAWNLPAIGVTRDGQALWTPKKKRNLPNLWVACKNKEIKAPQMSSTFAWNPVSYTTSFQPCSCRTQQWKELFISHWSINDYLNCWTDPELQHVPQWGSGRESCHWRELDVMPHEAESSPARPCAAPQSLGPCCLPTACATQTPPACKRTNNQTASNLHLTFWHSLCTLVWFTDLVLC